MQFIVKLAIIVALTWAVAAIQSWSLWFIVGMPLIYIVWRLEWR